MSDLPYGLVVGLEVHVQLATRTKLFCRCSTQFGAPPNTQVCPVCLGLPGSLPVMNRQAFQLALKTALALNCQIPNFTKWDRKQYYYPDLPKGYQISQYDLPMSHDGWLEISDAKERFAPKRIGIIRAHLEEDAGKSLHDQETGRGESRIDLNRTGTPLLEIVSQPDLRSPLEAKTYLTELKLLLTYLGVSDCNMQEGSLRVDANVNLHIASGNQVNATPIVEVKNMNSFRAVERALAYEGQRQYAQWQQTGQRLGDVPKQTRGWDDQAQVTRGQRSKEESSDYRYFPDPDLVPVTVTEAELQALRADIGELPRALRDRLADQYGLSAYDADVLVSQGRELVDYFLDVARLSADPKRSSNWLQQDVLRTMNDRNWTIEQFPIPAARLAELVRLVADDRLDSSRARDVFEAMLADGRSAADTMHALGIQQVDQNQLVALCRQLLADNPQIVQDVKEGKAKAIGSLIGQAKRINPNANPNQIREVCLKLIADMSVPPH
jgi:aspartyl-tRNA(Asn)/glutamyl-tRNA(Gln) amidotransferase subunit B